MGKTGAHAHRGPRRHRFPPDIERIVRRRRWSAWAAVAAFAVILLCGGTGRGYEFSDSRAHGIFIALALAVWATAVALVAAGTFRLRRRGVYTVGFLDAPFTPMRRWAAGYYRRGDLLPQWLMRAVFGVVVLAWMAVTLPTQVNAVAYLTDVSPTPMTSGRAVGYTLLAMVLDATVLDTLFGYTLRLGRRLRRLRARMTRDQADMYLSNQVRTRVR